MVLQALAATPAPETPPAQMVLQVQTAPRAQGMLHLRVTRQARATHLAQGPHQAQDMCRLRVVLLAQMALRIQVVLQVLAAILAPEMRQPQAALMERASPQVQATFRTRVVLHLQATQREASHSLGLRANPPPSSPPTSLGLQLSLPALLSRRMLQPGKCPLSTTHPSR